MVHIKLYRWLAALTLLGLIAGGSGGVSASPSAPGSKPGVISTENGLIIEWNAPPPEIITDGDGRIKISVPGYPEEDKPGYTYLPAASELIALPPNVQPELKIEHIEEHTIPLKGELAFAPVPDGALKSPDGEVVGTDYVTPKNPEPFTPNPLEIEYLGVMRGINLARVTFYPARPEGESLRVTTSIRVSIDFNLSDHRLLTPTAPLDPLQGMLKTKVANPDQLQISSPVSGSVGSLLLGPQAVNDEVIIEVTQRGIIEIKYSQLSNIGFNIGDANNVHLYHSGAEPGDPLQEVGIIQEDSKGRFLFYAEPRFSRWINFDTYVLKEESTNGLRMSTRSANPSGIPPGGAYVQVDEEQNKIYSPDDCYCLPLPPVRGGDRWVWQEIKIPLQGSISKTYNFDLPTVDTSKSGQLTLWLLGYTDPINDPDHQVEVRINNNLLSPVIEWNGKQSIQAELNIPASFVNEGPITNTLKLTLPGIVDLEGMYLDAYTVEYALGDSLIQGSLYFTGEQSQRSYTILFREAGDPPNFMAYDVTDPGNPIILTDVDIQPGSYPYTTVADTNSGGKHAYFFTGEDYLLSHEGMHKKATLSSSNADYVIISHSNFINALTPLINLRREQGKNVAVFDVHTIYDNYNAGKQQPEAIRAFLDDAYHNWSLPPLYVLLVGDGTSDPKGYVDSSTTYIPPYLVNVDPFAGETAADNRFVTVDPPGDEDDILPDMLIGRLPVNSFSEAVTVVNKITSYETSPPSGDWQKAISFVTDDPDFPGEPINNFPEDALHIDDNYTPDVYDTYHINYPAGENPDTTRTQIRNRWNAGTAIMLYIGHGAIKRWGKSFEGFWLLDDLNSLSNGTKQPFLFDMTCLTGKFQAFEDPTLAESTLRLENHGAVAVWGPTGLGDASGHVELAEGLFTEFFSGYITDLGKATLAGKVELLKDKPYYDDLVDTYVLFGDPATELQIADLVDVTTYFPLIFK